MRLGADRGAQRRSLQLTPLRCFVGLCLCLPCVRARCCASFPKKKPAAAGAAAAKPADKEAVHEDSVAVVTVVTREQNSDESDDDVSDDEEGEEDEEMDGSSRRQGIPFRRRDLDDAAAAASLPAGSASTPYNPNKSHQAAAILKAKHALKSKDKFKAKGMSSKGGHKYKKPKIMSKKKKIKMGNKKGANRDK